MNGALRLDATYVPGVADDGAMHLRLVNAGPIDLTNFRLAFTTVVPLTPPADAPTRLVTRISGYHEVATPPEFTLRAGGVWQLDPLSCGHRPGHANDGPASAFLIQADGLTRPVHVGATARADGPRIGRSAPPPLHLTDPTGVGAREWALAAACERRLHPHDSMVLADLPTGTPVVVEMDASLPADSFRITVEEDGCVVAAAAAAPLTSAFLTLARERRAETDHLAAVHTPIYEWRGLHIDLARQFIPAVDVEWLLDVAAWRGLNRLHLHLTDDEGWRVPITAYPALTDVGSWRGHGRVVPPLLGTAAAASGGFYTPQEIHSWVDRGTALGIELVPEIDVPGHSFAAIAAVPELTDPEDASATVSIQHFGANVLNPGMGATRPFLEAVFGELADLFPSPWLHLGGDEVPPGAWMGSPAAQRYAVAHGIEGTDAIAALFTREVVEIIAALGRRVGAWQDAAEVEGVRPGDGYVVAWRSQEDCRRLAATGHAVVAAPADVLYLDMAADRAWTTPGTSWAGHTSVDDIARFEATAGWSATERSNLLGIQACLWTEHVHDRATLAELLFPRLDAVAASAWSRTVT